MVTVPVVRTWSHSGFMFSSCVSSILSSSSSPSGTKPRTSYSHVCGSSKWEVPWNETLLFSVFECFTPVEPRFGNKAACLRPPLGRIESGRFSPFPIWDPHPRPVPSVPPVSVVNSVCRWNVKILRREISGTALQRWQCVLGNGYLSKLKQTHATLLSVHCLCIWWKIFFQGCIWHMPQYGDWWCIGRDAGGEQLTERRQGQGSLSEASEQARKNLFETWNLKKVNDATCTFPVRWLLSLAGWPCWGKDRKGREGGRARARSNFPLSNPFLI